VPGLGAARRVAARGGRRGARRAADEAGGGAAGGLGLAAVAGPMRARLRLFTGGAGTAGRAAAGRRRAIWVWLPKAQMGRPWVRSGIAMRAGLSRASHTIAAEAGRRPAPRAPPAPARPAPAARADDPPAGRPARAEQRDRQVRRARAGVGRARAQCAGRAPRRGARRRARPPGAARRAAPRARRPRRPRPLLPPPGLLRPRRPRPRRSPAAMPIEHVVSFAFKPGTAPDKIAAFFTDLEALAKAVPGITRLVHGANCSP
jgi:hypothetical protein